MTGRTAARSIIAQYFNHAQDINDGMSRKPVSAVLIETYPDGTASAKSFGNEQEGSYREELANILAASRVLADVASRLNAEASN